MKRLSLSVLVILFAGLMAGTASAGVLDKLMTVNIPFAFVADNDSYPAGEYEILGRFGTFFVWLKSSNGGRVGVAATIPNKENKTANDPCLVFNRYGDTYFLSKILVAGEREAKMVHKSRRELEQLAAGSATSTVQLRAAAKR